MKFLISLAMMHRCMFMIVFAFHCCMLSMQDVSTCLILAPFIYSDGVQDRESNTVVRKGTLPVRKQRSGVKKYNVYMWREGWGSIKSFTCHSFALTWTLMCSEVRSFLCRLVNHWWDRWSSAVFRVCVDSIVVSRVLGEKPLRREDEHKNAWFLITRLFYFIGTKLKPS